MFPQDTKILICDDMPSMRSLVKSQMNAMGYRNITSFENGELAYRAFIDELNKGTPFQLVLSDWNMPELTGLKFLERVRSIPNMKTLPFLLITAEGEFTQVKEAVALGVSDYVVKPFTPAILQKKLHGVWNRLYGNKK